MPKSTPEKREPLIQYVLSEIRRLQKGEITRLPTYQNLADQFGYKSPSSLYAFLKRRDLILGYLKTSENTCNIPKPSADLGWFLGVLSAGGSVDQNNGRILLTSAHENVLEKYRLIGERLFLLNAHVKPKSGWSGFGYEFDGVRVAKFLGDLRNEYWARTILSLHPWVVDNPVYTWGFINGFFEKRGRVYTYEARNKHLLVLWTSSRIGANLLVEMLAGQGLNTPGIRNTQKPSERVRGVTITNLRDINLFAQHVHSVVPEKEACLEYYRNIDPSEAIPGRRYTREEMIEEWRWMINELGRNPVYLDICEFRNQGKTKISELTYAKRFGEGSFPKAREELERIIQEGGS